MMILDRYVSRQFLSTILFALLGFVALFTIVDLLENLDDFIDNTVPGSLVLEYYTVFAPEIIRLMTPVSVLFGALFTVGKMSNVNELTAIKSSGVSFYRFMLPIVLISAGISAFSVYFTGYIVPGAIKQKLFIEREYLHKHRVNPDRDIFFQDAEYRIVHISDFIGGRNEALRVSVQKFSPKEPTRMVERVDIDRLRYDSTRTIWTAYNGTVRTFSDTAQQVSYFSTREMDSLNFQPEDLIMKQWRVEEMNLSELQRSIAEQRKAGFDPRRLEIEYHSRYAFALTSFIVVLFGMPFSANRRKSGLAVQFGINIAITFTYLGVMQIVLAFGKNGALDPVLTAWLTNVFFTIAALISILNVRQ